jgi:hypothetical protein
LCLFLAIVITSETGLKLKLRVGKLTFKFTAIVTKLVAVAGVLKQTLELAFNLYQD